MACHIDHFRLNHPKGVQNYYKGYDHTILLDNLYENACRAIKYGAATTYRICSNFFSILMNMLIFVSGVANGSSNYRIWKR